MASSLFAISAYTSKELQALLVGMKGMERPLKAQLRKATTKTVKPVWIAAVQGNARTKLEKRALGSTATVTVRDSNVTLKAGGKGKLLSKAPTLSKAAEFGADREFRKSFSTRSPKGTSYTVNRRTQRQLPTFNRKGNVVYPAAAKVIPRIAALWVQTSVRTLHEVLERK
ncbi:hypothetical protein [Marisediminicola sp. LYQ85]|uniref:hypothetical protein n=1 Tax=Marisediminicola sp. LYQ85 TaxID=3391062 RepID=UPI003983B3F6